MAAFAINNSYKGSAWIIWAVLILSITGVNATIMPVDPSQKITWPYHMFKTVDFEPPWLNTSHHGASSEGYLFFAPDGATPTQMAPVIMDMHGELVWNGPVEHGFAFGKYEYRGEPVLAWWNGSLFPEPVGRGNGVIYIYNNKYEQTHRVTLEGNFLELVPGETFESNIDVHEILFTSKGSLVVTANNVTQADLTSVGGPVDGWVVDAQVYEIDIETNEVLFSWSSLDHLDQLPFTASVYALGTEGYTGANQSLAWGYFHINAAEPYHGRYILSSRYLCSAVAIDGSDGRVKWRLNGRRGGDFDLIGSDDATGFCYQHDIRIVDQRRAGLTLRMHDNHNSPVENNTVPATAKILDLDFCTNEVSLVNRYWNHEGPTFPTAQGNYQPLANANHFVGHGWIPVMEEFSPSGSILTTIQFGDAVLRSGGGYLSAEEPTLSYRDFKHQWVGCPSARPDAVVESSQGALQVYMSWNGATEVEAWEVYGGSSAHALQHVATVPKNGFETNAKIDKVGYVQVNPVMKKGCSCVDRPASAVVEVS